MHHFVNDRIFEIVLLVFLHLPFSGGRILLHIGFGVKSEHIFINIFKYSVFTLLAEVSAGNICKCVAGTCHGST